MLIARIMATITIEFSSIEDLHLYQFSSPILQLSTEFEKDSCSFLYFNQKEAVK